MYNKKESEKRRRKECERKEERKKEKKTKNVGVYVCIHIHIYISIFRLIRSISFFVHIIFIHARYPRACVYALISPLLYICIYVFFDS